MEVLLLPLFALAVHVVVVWLIRRRLTAYRWAVMAVLPLAASYALIALPAAVVHQMSGVAEPTDVPDTTVEVVPKRIAAAAGMRDGDRIVSVDGQTVTVWKEMAEAIGARPDQRYVIEVVRDGKRVPIEITADGEAVIGVRHLQRYRDARLTESLWFGVSFAPRIWDGLLQRLLPHEEVLSGPVMIVKERESPRRMMGQLLAGSASLGAAVWPLVVIFGLAFRKKRKNPTSH